MTILQSACDSSALQVLRQRMWQYQLRRSGKLIDIQAERSAYARQLGKAEPEPGTVVTAVTRPVAGEWVHGEHVGSTRAMLFVHGGGFVMGSCETHRALASRLARTIDGRVFVVEYRLAPEHPFPSALDDVLRAWQWLRSQGIDADDLTVAGDSAGGGLAASAVLSLRDRNEDLPAGLILLSPWADLGLTGASFWGRGDADPVVQPDFVNLARAMYAGALDFGDPAISPIHADWSAMPRTLVQVGGHERLYDDARRIVDGALTAGVDAALEVWPTAIHVWHQYGELIPEAGEAISAVGRFVLELDELQNDEFSGLESLSADLGLSPTDLPRVRRREFMTGDGAHVSGLQWREGNPELVMLHGGGQNAHTWDQVLLMVDRPALAIDLPGHGRSSWRVDRDYLPPANAVAVRDVLGEVSAGPFDVVGMSLGGLTGIRLAAEYMDRVRRLVVVDVLPAVTQAPLDLSPEDLGSVSLIHGPRTFQSFESMLLAAMSVSPGRDVDAVRRGLQHNAMQLDDGSWAWRYDSLDRVTSTLDSSGLRLWEDLDRVGCPIMLVLGGNSRFVNDAQLDELKSRRPDVRVVVVPAAGHAVQSHRPVRLASLISSFLDE